MGAYNWIHVHATCPTCARNTEIRCQTHVASSYDGDDTGRFFDRTYTLGQQMAWWPRDHKAYDSWRDNGRKDAPTDGEVDWECCYSTCAKCASKLYVVIRFSGPTPVAVESVGFESDWPDGFW